MITKKEILQQLQYLKQVPEENFLELLKKSDDFDLIHRLNQEGHVTVSAVVYHLHTNEVLLLKHKADDLWGLPECHLTPHSPSVTELLLRELAEHTGIPSEWMMPARVGDGIQRCIALNTRFVPCNPRVSEPGHNHYNFQFLFGYAGGSRLSLSASKYKEYQWVDKNEIMLQPIVCWQDWDDLLLHAMERFAWQEIEKGSLLTIPLGAYQYKKGCGYLEAGALTSAAGMFKKSIASYRNTYDEQGETPVEIYNPAMQLVNCYICAGRVADALQACREVLELLQVLRESGSGENYLNLEIEVYLKAGRICASSGSKEMAFYYHEKAVECLYQILYFS